MAATKITSQLVRFLHSLNRFKEVYIEEREIIGEPLFEGLPELRIREQTGDNYLVKIKGTDVSFILESLRQYFKEFGYVGHLFYSSMQLLVKGKLETLFFTEEDHVKFQELIDYLEYDSPLRENMENLVTDSDPSNHSEIIIGMETYILFTKDVLQVNMPEEVSLTSTLRDLLLTSMDIELYSSSHKRDDLEDYQASLTSTLNKLMNIHPRIQEFAEYVVGTAWYELFPRSAEVLRFDPVIRKIPELYVRYDKKSDSVYLVVPYQAQNSKFILKILDYFDSSAFQQKGTMIRFFIDGSGVISLNDFKEEDNFPTVEVMEIIGSEISRIYGEFRTFKVYQYELSLKKERVLGSSATQVQSIEKYSRSPMGLPSSVVQDRGSDIILSTEDYEEEFYDIRLDNLLTIINSLGISDKPLSLEELELLLFINERKNKKVQSNIIVKKLGIKKEKIKELLRGLSDSGWLKVSHGWYSLRPSKAKLLEELLEEQKQELYLSGRSSEESSGLSKSLESSTNDLKTRRGLFAKSSSQDLTPEEMKALLLKEKMEKQFNEDDEEFYEDINVVDAFGSPYPAEVDERFEWEDDWEEDMNEAVLVGDVSISRKRKHFTSVSKDDDFELRVNESFIEDKEDYEDEKDSQLESLVEKPYIDELSEEERLFLQRKRLSSMKKPKIHKSSSTDKMTGSLTATKLDIAVESGSPPAVERQIDGDSQQKISLNDHLQSLSIAGFTDEEIQVILALLNYKDNKMVFKSLVKYTTLKKTRLKKVVKELVKKGVIKRLRGDYVTIDYESPNPNLKEVLKLKDLLNQRRSNLRKIELSSEEMKVIEAMAKHKDFKAQSNSIANETGLTKQKTKEILKKFASIGICNVTRGWYALNERIAQIILGDELWNSIKNRYQPKKAIPYPSVPLTDDEKLIYDAIRGQKSLKAQSNLIARKTGLDRDYIREILRSLVEKGVLKVKHGWYCMVFADD